MDINTGELKEIKSKDLETLLKENEDWVRINEEDMTDKQKKEMKVSLHDHKSKLGKVLTKNRKRKLKRKGIIR